MKDKIINTVLSIVIFIIPILIVQSNELDYNIVRYIVLLICSEILLIMFFINIRDKKVDAIYALVLIFVILTMISTVFSYNIKTSIIGSYCRYEGLLTIITYALIYYNAKYYFKLIKRY